MPLSQRKKLKKQEGQLVLEYVLLLATVTLLGTLVLRLLIGEGGQGGESGLILQKWTAVIQTIASEVIDN